VHIRFLARLVIRDRLEQNCRLRARLFAQPVSAIAFAAGPYFVPIWVIDFIHLVVVRCATGNQYCPQALQFRY
jgi:hypothetical protein